MKKVLYISNIEVPYRSEFFNQLAQKINLTVLYERRKSSNRNENWVKSVQSNYNIKYLDGLKIKKEYSFNIKILKYLFSNEYNSIIIGCYNSPSEMLLILFMKLFKKKYILNLDGEYFFEGKGLKKRIKRFFVKGADKYLIAGIDSARNLSKVVLKDKIFPYYFSSLTEKEILKNAECKNKNNNDCVLVIGQYYDYKGLDFALKIASYNQSIKYKFIGSGNRSNLLKQKVDNMGLTNVEIIPFLEKKMLYREYQNSLCLFVPTRQECWGLVVNEAASFGCPIISTNGSGAAREFLSGKFKDYLSSDNKMYDKIHEIKNNKNLDEYRDFLINKSKQYSIEKMVEKTYECIIS